jgi:hypothetical protein
MNHASKFSSRILVPARIQFETDGHKLLLNTSSSAPVIQAKETSLLLAKFSIQLDEQHN